MGTRNSTIINLFTSDKHVAIAILLNAVILFLLSFDHFAQNYGWLNTVDLIFLLYFALEAFFKIREDGWKKYIKQNWNKFDFIILVISLPSVLLLFEKHLAGANFMFIFRIIRLVRFFKFLRFIPNIAELIAGIRRAFKASIFVLLAFFIYMFVISMMSCRMFKEVSPDHFGNPVVSFYSIFKVFTIEGWYEIPDQIHMPGPYATFFVKLYFVLIVISGGLFGLSIVNAIFVEEMVRDNNDDLERKVGEMDEKLDRLLTLYQEQLSRSQTEEHLPKKPE